jgi:hypothetical protein
MDLLGFLGAAKQALEFIRPAPGYEANWANDENEFERHFGVPYEVFLEIVEHLSPDQKKLLDATANVNPEAAVLWILAMEEVDE